MYCAVWTRAGWVWLDGRGRAGLGGRNHARSNGCESHPFFVPDDSNALGQGWRVGFLGMLHMDVFIQRLEQEYGATVIATHPTVPYKCTCVERAHGRDRPRS